MSETESKNMALNEEQKAAVETRSGPILVSAAAGSGKTTVLIQRILNRILDPDRPSDVDRLLVVTFTKDAAAQMRSRLASALRREIVRGPENQALVRQLVLLPGAQISTVHSFCEFIMRRFFSRADLDPNFRVLDEYEAALLQSDAADNLFERLYRGSDPEFLDLVARYGSAKTDDAVKNLVLQLHARSRNHPVPALWFEQAKELYDSARWKAEIISHPWIQTLLRLTRLDLVLARMEFDQAAMMCQPYEILHPRLETAALDIQAADKAIALIETAADWDTLIKKFQDITFAKAAAIRNLPEELKGVKKLIDDIRTAARNRAHAALDRIAAFKPGCMETMMFETAPMVGAFIKLAEQFHEEYSALKRQAAAVDFNDLEHCALKILSDPDSTGALIPSEAALEIRERFDEVLVDEYQDINPVQEAILGLVSRADGAGRDRNRFMVGDLKQSIYRFRLADPGIFLEKFRAFKDKKTPGALINLPCNFRSRAPIVNCVNFLFRQIMTRGCGELDYDTDAELKRMAPYPETPESTDPELKPIELYLIPPPPKNADSEIPETDIDEENEEEKEEESELQLRSRDEREATLIANLIRRMIPSRGQGQFQILDAESRQYRPVRYGDIAILTRAWGPMPAYKDALARAGIPVFSPSPGGWFKAVEISDMMSLFRVIDNPRQDIPLAAVMRCPVMGDFSAEELARIRIENRDVEFFEAALAYSQNSSDKLGARLKGFLSRLDRWRTRARRDTLQDLVADIYRETGYPRFAAALPAGDQRLANLNEFLNRARQFDTFSRRGVSRFLEFMDRVMEQSDLGLPKVPEPDRDAVLMLTIHGSKGLEFPVVFLPNLSREFHGRRNSGPLTAHPKLGIGLRHVDPEAGVSRSTPALEAIKFHQELEDMAEELRVLYTAMTRARERLVLIGSEPGRGDIFRNIPFALNSAEPALPDPVIRNSNSFLEWIFAALSRHESGAAIRERIGADPLFDNNAGADPRVCPQGRTHGCAPTSRLEAETADSLNLLNGDPSLWEILFLAQDSELLDDSGWEQTDTKIPREAILKLAPLPSPKLWSEKQKERLVADLCWEYSFPDATRAPAKLSVSEVKRRSDAVLDSEDKLFDWDFDRLARPEFMEETRAALSPPELGAATHRILECIDLNGDFSLMGIKAQVSDMVERGLISRLEADAVAPESILWVFETEPGKFMAANPGKTRRELPFSILLPADEILPDLNPESLRGESVLVQGIIDVLLEYDQGFVLLDFKTDSVGPDQVETRARSYLRQMELYGRAVREILGKPVIKRILMFLKPGKLVEI